jgi:dihydrofolate reductase
MARRKHSPPGSTESKTVTSNTAGVTVHMVASLDGFIAKRDNSIGWLDVQDRYDRGVAGENAEEFVKSIGCYVMGSRTYEHAVELSRAHGWAYGDVPTIVLTHRKLPPVHDGIELYAGDLAALVNERLKRRYASIWVVGGAAVVKELIRLGLADEIRYTIVPILIGGGTPFFDELGLEQALHLKDVTAYKNGMVELRYEIRK